MTNQPINDVIAQMPRPEGLLIVGVTGRSGSGKSSVVAHYAAFGYPTADGDVLSREVCRPGQPCMDELVAAFGREIVKPDGQLDRKALGRLAFATPEANRTLIGITHPHIARRTLQLAFDARRAGHRLFFVDGAVIIGVPFRAVCDRIVLVQAHLRLSISRIILRDGISKTAAYARLAAQQPDEVLCREADYILQNNGSVEALLKQADDVLASLRREAEA